MSPFDTLEFKELQRKWYDKLKATGFKDIELPGYQDSPFMEKNEARTHAMRKRNPEREQFFQSAGRFLYVYNKFVPETKLMWTMHAEGRTYQDIRKAVNTSFGKTYSHFYIFRKIKMLTKIMLRNLDLLLLTDEAIEELTRYGKINFI